MAGSVAGAGSALVGSATGEGEMTGSVAVGSELPSVAVTIGTSTGGTGSLTAVVSDMGGTSVSVEFAPQTLASKTARSIVVSLEVE